MRILTAAAVVLVLGLTPVLLAADQTKSFGQLFKEELEKEKAKRAAEEAKKSGQAAPAPATDDRGLKATRHPTVDETELAGFFERNPSTRAQWPRVVLTIIEAPPWHLESQNVTTNRRVTEAPGSGCWAVRAKIWDSETQSRDVPTFYRCMSEGLRTPTSSEGLSYRVWTGLEGPPRPSAGLRRDTTGNERTEGPMPPDTALPSSAAFRARGFQQTYSGYAIFTVLRLTGFVFDSADRRLWVNVAPELAPPLDGR